MNHKRLLDRRKKKNNKQKIRYMATRNSIENFGYIKSNPLIFIFIQHSAQYRTYPLRPTFLLIKLFPFIDRTELALPIRLPSINVMKRLNNRYHASVTQFEFSIQIF